MKTITKMTAKEAEQQADIWQGVDDGTVRVYLHNDIYNGRNRRKVRRLYPPFAFKSSEGEWQYCGTIEFRGLYGKAPCMPEHLLWIVRDDNESEAG